MLAAKVRPNDRCVRRQRRRFAPISETFLRRIRSTQRAKWRASNVSAFSRHTGEAPMRNQRTDLKQETIPTQSNVLESKRAGRRDFLLSLGASAAGAAALGATTFGHSSALAQQANLDVAILEFALNLEYL